MPEPIVLAFVHGWSVTARPAFGPPGEAPESFAGYQPSEFRFTGRDFAAQVKPNETVYVDIVLSRYVDREALRFDPLSAGKGSFKDAKPSGAID